MIIIRFLSLFILLGLSARCLGESPSSHRGSYTDQEGNIVYTDPKINVQEFSIENVRFLLQLKELFGEPIETQSSIMADTISKVEEQAMREEAKQFCDARIKAWEQMANQPNMYFQIVRAIAVSVERDVKNLVNAKAQLEALDTILGKASGFPDEVLARYKALHTQTKKYLDLFDENDHLRAAVAFDNFVGPWANSFTDATEWRIKWGLEYCFQHSLFGLMENLAKKSHENSIREATMRDYNLSQPAQRR